ncbi:MAG: S-adenosylmethionine decarboxylase [Patescibacteria group bacterium]
MKKYLGFIMSVCFFELHDFDIVFSERKVRKIVKDGIRFSALHIVSMQSYRFEKEITVAVILRESHIIIHLFSKERFMHIDLFTCGAHARRKAERFIRYLKNQMQPQRTTEVKEYVM